MSENISRSSIIRNNFRNKIKIEENKKKEEKPSKMVKPHRRVQSPQNNSER